MPSMVSWIEGWLAVADSCDQVKFLVTDYAEMARDNRAYIEKILGFYEIPYRQDWLIIPKREVGHNNIFSLAAAGAPSGEQPSVAASKPSLNGEILDLANAAMPQGLIERFGWSR